MPGETAPSSAPRRPPAPGRQASPKRRSSLGMGWLARIAGVAGRHPAWRNPCRREQMRKCADRPHVQRESGGRPSPRFVDGARLIAQRAPSDDPRLAWGGSLKSWVRPASSRLTQSSAMAANGKKRRSTPCPAGKHGRPPAGACLAAQRAPSDDPRLAWGGSLQLGPMERGGRRAAAFRQRRSRPAARSDFAPGRSSAVPIHDVQQQARQPIREAPERRNKYRTFGDECKPRIARRAGNPAARDRDAPAGRPGWQPCHPHRLCITSAARIRRPAKSGRSFGDNMRP
jgi:hypothetical protein